MAFKPKGDVAMWRAVHDHAAALSPGDLIPYATLSDLLGYDLTVPGASRTPIQVAGRRLLDSHERTLIAVRGVGYRVALASEHEGLARGGQRSARRKLARAHTVAVRVDRNQLTTEQQSSLDAFAHVLAQQNAMLKRNERRVAAVETSVREHDERIEVLEATLRRHGIAAPKVETIAGEAADVPGA